MFVFIAAILFFVAAVVHELKPVRFTWVFWVLAAIGFFILAGADIPVGIG